MLWLRLSLLVNHVINTRTIYTAGLLCEASDAAKLNTERRYVISKHCNENKEAQERYTMRKKRCRAERVGICALEAGIGYYVDLKAWIDVVAATLVVSARLPLI